MKERRHTRFSIEDRNISGRMVSASEVKLFDISLGGISLKADKRLEIGGEYSLQLEYGENRTLSLSGAVVWSMLTGTIEEPHRATIYKAGMRFNYVSMIKLNEIIDALKELPKVDVDKPDAEFCPEPLPIKIPNLSARCPRVK